MFYEVAIVQWNDSWAKSMNTVRKGEKPKKCESHKLTDWFNEMFEWTANPDTDWEREIELIEEEDNRDIWGVERKDSGNIKVSFKQKLKFWYNITSQCTDLHDVCLRTA